MHRQVSVLIGVLLLLAGCAAAAPGGEVNVERLYAVRCQACHAIEAGADESLGPALGAIRARAAAEADPAGWLRLAITQPNAEIAPGYQAGLMPADYAAQLSAAEIDGLVQYMIDGEEAGG